MKENEARLMAVRLLEARGYGVRDVSSGQGRPKFSVVELSRGGSRQLCSIKVADKAVNGRISYALKDGNFTVLSDVDLVLHVRPMVDGSLHTTMFDQANVLEAFQRGKKALDDAGKSNLPVWVSPKPETGWRQVGSGFGKHAIWSVTMTPDGPKGVKDGNQNTEIEPLSIAQAKMAVAAKYDVSPENVEIIVRG